MRQTPEARRRRLAGRSSFQNERPHVIHPLVKKDFDRAMQERDLLLRLLPNDFAPIASEANIPVGQAKRE